jgi:hypothetical protein
MSTEKFIVAVKQWGLGFLKETVYRGNVITVDHERNILNIDGRQFSDVRDIDIAKRQAEKFPENPLIVPFSEETLRRFKAGSAPVVAPKPKPGENMKVVKSDEDLHETIDIADTQVSRKSREAKDAERNKAKVEKLPVVKGDETPEDRVERIREEKLKEKIPVVRDDSLGYEGGSKAAALNAGQRLPSLAEVKTKEETSRQLAESRKREAEAKRAVLAPVTSNNEGARELQDLVAADESAMRSPVPVVVPPVETETKSSQAETEVLTPSDDRMAALESQVAALSTVVGNLVQAIAPDGKITRRAVKRAKKSVEPAE